MSEKILLEMKNITKVFPGVKALDDVNLKVKEGSIHALVGENGAGKSTLMNVLSGIYPYRRRQVDPYECPQRHLSLRYLYRRHHL